MRKKLLAFFFCMFFFPVITHAASLAANEIARQLGWVETGENRCGGYYREAPFDTSLLSTKDAISMTSEQGLFSLHGTSMTQGKVTITRLGQQITASKAYIYRDPVTGKLSSIDLIDHVVLREPNELIVAEKGHYEIKTKRRSLQGILFRSAISNSAPVVNFKTLDLDKERHVTQLSAWGRAKNFIQNEPKIYLFDDVSYTTCPPLASVWNVLADKITLNKITGRGTARNARVYVKDIPVFYSPYLNFPIDDRRQTGFLTPTVGSDSQLGYSIGTPFYWNLAPNYDTTITPLFTSLRTLQLSDTTRYLTHKSKGEVYLSVVPHDKTFSNFQSSEFDLNKNSMNPIVQAELNHLQNASTSRGSFSWQNETIFNEHWSGLADYTYVTDDYYLQNNLGSRLNQVTQNQLLQDFELRYKGEHWGFMGRSQAYQTLHPLEASQFKNSYSRFPQLVLDGDYPDNKFGLDFFVSNELTHFNIANNPGLNEKNPMGNRINIQPGVSLPLSWPFLYLTPRLQYEVTQYQLGNVDQERKKTMTRSLPIFDVSSNIYLDRSLRLSEQNYRQTLEPQLYYTYIPFRNQNSLPVFDTTQNNLSYDQLFLYNRFSGIDRINDANQIAVGLTTRFLEEASGAQKAKAGIGQIIYFKARQVTLNNNPTTDELQRHSPISAVFEYNIAEHWSLTGNSIINPKNNDFNNQTIELGYKSDQNHIVHLSYSFVENGDIDNVDGPQTTHGNLNQTDVSVVWPMARDWSSIGRWTENWNQKRFLNMLYGVQYDSCCWAVRAVASKTFISLTPKSNSYMYNTGFFIQFALKGLGNIGKDPTALLASSIPGYEANFGRDF